MTLKRAEFTVTRDITARPSIVWDIWADPALKRRWISANDGPGWELDNHTMSFSLLGQERTRWIADDPGQPWHGHHVNHGVFLDIEPGKRIVTAYSMAMQDVVHSAALGTAEFIATDTGTRISYSEQITLFPNSYGVEVRKQGWTRLLETLEHQIAAAS